MHTNPNPRVPNPRVKVKCTLTLTLGSEHRATILCRAKVVVHLTVKRGLGLLEPATHMWGRLQPYAGQAATVCGAGAATVCGAGCNRMWGRGCNRMRGRLQPYAGQRLQPYAGQAATVAGKEGVIPAALGLTLP